MLKLQTENVPNQNMTISQKKFVRSYEVCFSQFETGIFSTTAMETVFHIYWSMWKSHDKFFNVL